MTKRTLISRKPPTQPRKILKSTCGSRFLQKRPPTQPPKPGDSQLDNSHPKEAVGLKKEDGTTLPLSNKLLNCLQPHQVSGSVT